MIPLGVEQKQVSQSRDSTITLSKQGEDRLIFKNNLKKAKPLSLKKKEALLFCIESYLNKNPEGCIVKSNSNQRRVIKKSNEVKPSVC